MKISISAAGLALAVSMTASAGTVSQSDSRITSAPDASTRQAVERFVEAYTRHDAAALSHTVTKDFTARLYETRSVSHVTVTADGLARSWQRQDHLMASTYPELPAIGIYATPQARTVFVSYQVTGQTAVGKRIALVEMRGHRVARVKDFPGSSESTRPGRADVAIAAN